MAILGYRTALVTIENALADVINLALRRRDPAINNVDELRAMVTRGASGSVAIPDRAVRYLTDPGVCYVFRQSSTAADDNDSIIRPTDAGTRPGRWIKATSTIVNPAGDELRTVQTGYVRGVIHYEGERPTGRQWDERILGVRPGVVIQYVGETKDQKSNLRGGLYVKLYHFRIWGVCFNARPNVEAALGSPITAEAAADPGVKTLMGDLEDLLDGMTGAELGIAGVDHLRLGETDPAIEDLTQREFIWIAPLDVRATVGKEDRPPRTEMTTLTGQGQDPDDGTPRTPTYYALPTS